MDIISEEAMDARARRAAKRIGLVAAKSRWRAGTSANWRGFQIRNPYRNAIIHGENYNLSAEEVIELCDVSFSNRFRKVANKYVRRVTEAYDGNQAQAMLDDDETVAAKVRQWEIEQGLEPRDWHKVGWEDEGRMYDVGFENEISRGGKPPSGAGR